MRDLIALAPQTSETLVAVVANGSGRKGGVDLLVDRLLTRTIDGIRVEARTVNDVIPLLESSPGKHVIFLQSEGTRNQHLEKTIAAWIGAGATVVEEQIFALPAAGRRFVPGYVPLFMSYDGYVRHVLRARTSGHRPFPGAVILPNPVLHEIPPRTKDSSREHVRMLRVGRPDARKWTEFEVRLAMRIAARAPATHFTLTLVGAPRALVRRRRTLPSNLDLVFHSYDAAPARHYQEADVYLHHSRIGESFGNTLVEASIAGCLVVCGLDLAWDCAPLETLDRNVHIVRSHRSLLRHPPDVVQRLALRDIAPNSHFLTVDEFASRVLSCGDPERVAWVQAPSLSDSLKWLRSESTALDCARREFGMALVRETLRSIARAMRRL